MEQVRVAEKAYVFSAYGRLSAGTSQGAIILKASYDSGDPSYQEVASGALDDSGWNLIQVEYTFNPDATRSVIGGAHLFGRSRSRHKAVSHS